MDFEAAISLKIIAAIKQKSPGTDVLCFGEFLDDYNKSCIAVNVEPRVNICGPLFRVNVTLIAVTVSAADKTRTQLSALDAITGDYIEDIKADPSGISGDGDSYTVDGAVNTDPSPVPELLDKTRARIRSFDLFVSYSHTTPLTTP